MKILFPVLGVLLGIALLAPANAESEEDCSSLKKWDSSKSYKEKDVVWYEGSGDGAKYACQNKTCLGGNPARTSLWKQVAKCKKGTKPK